MTERFISDMEVEWIREIGSIKDRTTIEETRLKNRIRRLKVSALNASQRLVLCHEENKQPKADFVLGAIHSWRLSKDGIDEPLTYPENIRAADYFISPFAQQIEALVGETLQNPDSLFEYHIANSDTTFVLSNLSLLSTILSYSQKDIRIGLPY